MSLRGLKEVLSDISSNIELLNVTGCSGGVSEICYAFDSLHSKHANYIVSTNCNTSSTITISSCDSYTSPSGNYTWTSSDTYQDTIPNAANCDSVITVNLAISNKSDIDNTITQTGNTLSANETGATYQWVDCGTRLLLSGETNKDYAPTSNGEYAVKITKNSCLEVSDCINIISVGLVKKVNDSDIIIYPNPASSTINTEVGTLDIFDAIGNPVLSTESNGKVDVSNLESGVYIVTQNGQRTKLIIE